MDTPREEKNLIMYPLPLLVGNSVLIIGIVALVGATQRYSLSLRHVTNDISAGIMQLHFSNIRI